MRHLIVDEAGSAFVHLKSLLYGWWQFHQRCETAVQGAMRDADVKMYGGKRAAHALGLPPAPAAHHEYGAQEVGTLEVQFLPFFKAHHVCLIQCNSILGTGAPKGGIKFLIIKESSD